MNKINSIILVIFFILNCTRPAEEDANGSGKSGNSKSSHMEIMVNEVRINHKDVFEFKAIPEGTKSKKFKFEIKNTGNNALQLTGFPVISIDAANEENFSITQPEYNVIYSGNSIEFYITFKPNAIIDYNASIEIATNDVYNPFIIILKGAGISRWIKHLNKAPWSNRSDYAVTIFKEQIWISGGRETKSFNDPRALNDIWVSGDGEKWKQITGSASWPARFGHTSLVFNDKIWVMGGRNNSSKNDVWFSSDGLNWTQGGITTQWSERYGHSSVVYDGRVWVIGGCCDIDNNPFNDVWFSIDGFNWTQASDSAAWPAIYNHSSLIYENKIWLVGGTNNIQGTLNHVWFSTDANFWNQAIGSAPWSAYLRSTVVYDDKLWVIGGTDNDIWFSNDGFAWTKIEDDVFWNADREHKSFVFKNEIWVLSSFEEKTNIWSANMNGF